eukprot:1365506-Amphidinium_carterae.1
MFRQGPADSPRSGHGQRVLEKQHCPLHRLKASGHTFLSEFDPALTILSSLKGSCGVWRLTSLKKKTQ